MAVRFCFLLCLFFSSCLVNFAKENNSGNKLVEYLVQEKINLTLAINETQLSQQPTHETDYLKFVQENEAKRMLNQAKIASLESFLANQKKLQEDFTQKLKQLQQTLVTAQSINSQQHIAKINTLIEVNQKTIELINDNLVLAKRYQEGLNNQKQQLDSWKAEEQMHSHLGKLKQQTDQLNESLSKFYENSIKMQEQLKSSHDFEANYFLQSKLLLNNQVINLTQHKIAEVELQKRLAQADYLLLKNPDIRTLQKVTDAYKGTIIQLSSMEQSLKKIATMLTEEQGHIKDNKLKQQFMALLNIVNSRIEGIVIQQQTLQEDLENQQDELKKQLSARQGLADYRLASWPIILEQLTHAPGQVYSYLKSIVLKVKDNYIWQDSVPHAIMWLVLTLIAVAGFLFHNLLKRLMGDKERSRLSGHLYDGALTVLSRNIPLLIFTAALIALFYLNHLSFFSYQLLINLIFIWLIFRVLILIARISLLERVSDSSGTDVRLYYRIKWLLLAGGWTTALMAISDQLPLSLLLQDIFSRLFMLFLLAVSLVAWKSRDFIVHMLLPVLKTKRKYFRSAVMLLVVLVPLTLFTTAVIGLIGYINLAWTMSRYQALILLLITAYVVVRGLIFDALELISEWMISALPNGWLWIEVFLKPLDKILRVLLFIFALFILSELFDWHSDSTVFTALHRFGEYPLINVSGIHITAISILEFVLVASLFVWLSKWTREFCYRWLYRNARDAGIRNSLAVFSQYAVILLGGFITLRVLGLDFSGMAMVIGGLAVGMGFGLRDFASNIVGGIMLLIERPVREGDLITLGSHEGRVAHIGIRSMRVSSWDNMEVLIPNAETFSKPFTNWTHQDSIIRTVIPIKVSRADDPTMIQQLILDVLAIIPEIVDEPPAQVFLKQIDEALIEFEVRYFINVQLHTRVEIRSKVLFAITAQFKAAGIKPPIPPISVELKEGENEVVISSKALEQ